MGFRVDGKVCWMADATLTWPLVRDQSLGSDVRDVSIFVAEPILPRINVLVGHM